MSDRGDLDHSRDGWADLAAPQRIRDSVRTSPLATDATAAFRPASGLVETRLPGCVRAVSWTVGGRADHARGRSGGDDSVTFLRGRRTAASSYS
jgi:hypothetical protein